jgi:hypothetical protein
MHDTQPGANMDTALFNVPPRATIRPWLDPVVDEHGHDPRSAYVERFWLGVIGPTATWIMRRLADGFDSEPSGYEGDLDHTATAMGLSFTKGAASPFGKALHRCVMFGLAQPIADGLAVRRRLPQVAARHLRRLPEELQAEHLQWARMTLHVDAKDLERRLLEAGIPPRAVPRATEAVLRAS